MPAAPHATLQNGRPGTPSPQALALRARLVADDTTAGTTAAQARLGAICATLAKQLRSHDVEPHLLATIDRKRAPGAAQTPERATAHGTAWLVGHAYLTAVAPCLLDGGPGTPATASTDGLSVTRYATTLLYPWHGPAPEGLTAHPSSALLLEESPTPVWVRGVLHTVPDGDVERDAIGRGAWYVRDADTTITLHDTGDGLVLRDLERDLARDVVAMTAWWGR